MAGPSSNAPRPLEPGVEASTHAAVRASGEVIAVTERDDFLLELGEALGGQVSLRPVDTLAAALEHLSGSRCAQLLAIDTRASADARADVDRAHAQAPHVPIVVFAFAETERSVATSLKGSNVFAVLPIPIDRRKTSVILEGALADANALRPAAKPMASAAPERSDARVPLMPEPLASQESLAVAGLGSGGSQPGSPALWIAAAAGALALAGGVAWYLLTRSTPTTATTASAPVSAPAPAEGQATSAVAGAAPAAKAPPAPVTSSAPEPVIQGTVDELLEKARLAMRERRYTEPAANCALLYYRSVLAADPANGEARDGMDRLARLLTTRFDDDASAGRFDEAASALAGLKVASPKDPRLGALEARLLQFQIDSAFTAGNLDRASALVRQAQQVSAVPAAAIARWRAELARTQNDARIRHLEDLFTARIREGKLLDPSDDSAKSYLDQLTSLAPNDSVAQHGAREFVAACLRKARDAALAGRADEADHWTSAARSAGATPAELTAYQRDLGVQRQHAASAQADRLAGLARARLDDGQLTEPANDNAIFYLDELKSAAPNSTALAAIGRELATRLVERATSDAHAGHTREMTSDLALARSWGADPTLVEAVQQIAAGGARAGAAVQRSGPQLPPGFAPKRLRYTAPDYPDNALDAHVSGSVTVNFIIDYNGRPTGVRVVASSPAGVFDRAAVSAVEKWRYQPVIIDNVAMEVPTGAIIRFQAPK